MSSKKAQSALEFLTTYGWAIFVVLVVMGAMIYFGVLSPHKFMHDKCLAATGVECTDYQVKVNEGGQSVIKLVIHNNLGNPAVIDYDATGGTYAIDAFVVKPSTCTVTKVEFVSDTFPLVSITDFTQNPAPFTLVDNHFLEIKLYCSTQTFAKDDVVNLEYIVPMMPVTDSYTKRTEVSLLAVAK